MKYFGWAGRIIGYVKDGDKWINTYRKRFKKVEASEYASHLMNEWMHIVGFDHYKGKKEHTVLYAVGRIVEELADGIDT